MMKLEDWTSYSSQCQLQTNRTIQQAQPCLYYNIHWAVLTLLIIPVLKQDFMSRWRNSIRIIEKNDQNDQNFIKNLKKWRNSIRAIENNPEILKIHQTSKEMAKFNQNYRKLIKIHQKFIENFIKISKFNQNHRKQFRKHRNFIKNSKKWQNSVRIIEN